MFTWSGLLSSCASTLLPTANSPDGGVGGNGGVSTRAHHSPNDWPVGPIMVLCRHRFPGRCPGLGEHSLFEARDGAGERTITGLPGTGSIPYNTSRCIQRNRLARRGELRRHVMPEAAFVKPELIRWAVERSCLPAEELTERFPKLDQWQRGQRRPTMKQLEDLAKRTMTPLGYFFLDEPPDETLPIPDFRTAGDSRVRAVRRYSPGTRGSDRRHSPRMGFWQGQVVQRAGSLAFSRVWRSTDIAIPIYYELPRFARTGDGGMECRTETLFLRLPPFWALRPFWESSGRNCGSPC